MSNNEIVPLPSVEVVKESEVPILLQNIRPAWQVKNLILRVKRLLEVDPSSACQRLFNAAIHDLREKVYIAGLDIAKEAAKQNKLPPIDSQESLEDYPTAKLIDLAYRVGLLTRPEWRRLRLFPIIKHWERLLDNVMKKARYWLLIQKEY